ncbi:MAG: hypothetical protein HRT35_17740 [Algicola sp.]|nr:hypothetical protein [Algicola sp.]
MSVLEAFSDHDEDYHRYRVRQECIRIQKSDEQLAELREQRIVEVEGKMADAQAKAKAVDAEAKMANAEACGRWLNTNFGGTLVYSSSIRCAD